MKRPHRRQFLHLAAGAAALPFAPHVARAQAYPTQPVNPSRAAEIARSLIPTPPFQESLR